MPKIKELSYRIMHTEQLAEDVTRFFLYAPKEDAFVYEAGQYIKVVHPDQSLSPLSIACAPRENGVIELHLSHARDNQAGQEILNLAKKNQQLLLRGPYGSCTADKLSPIHPVIFVARGTGFAPIKAIIEELSQFSHYLSLHFYWSGTYLVDLYLHELVCEWMKRLKNFSYTPVLSKPPVEWQGRVGLLQHVISGDYPDLTHYQVYTSAPEVIVYDVLFTLEQKGLKKNAYFSDVFDYLARE